MENKADYPRAGSNVSSCRYQLLAIDLPDRMIWQKDCFLLSTRSPHYRMAFDRIQFQERHRQHSQSCKHHRSLQRHQSHTRCPLSSQSCDQSNGR